MNYIVSITALILSICLSDMAVADWQYTRWGMPKDDLIRMGKGNVTPISREQMFPLDPMPGGRRGSAVDFDSEETWQSGYTSQGITYVAVYHFRANRLVAVSLIPGNVPDGIKTGNMLEAIYGAPEREQRMGREEGSIGCGLRRRWRAESESNIVTFFNQCGANFEVRYEPIPRGGGGL